ncbi:MAG: phage portal protein [Pseudomonadota bacterium]
MIPDFLLPKAPEEKTSRAKTLISLQRLGQPAWTPRDYASLARAGYEKNVIAFRCVRLVAEAAAAAPLSVVENGVPMAEHPLARLLTSPNPEQSGAELLETFYGYLQTAGNAYLEAALIDGAPRELYALRPDRMKARPGAGGWPDAWDYSVAGRTVTFRRAEEGVSPIMHLKLFHPTNDHYGLSPLEAAASSVDLHNAASAWNKALLDNAARPSGALVYKGPDGAENLTAEQFDRLKAELEGAYQGSAHAGRPLVLDGGLEWRSMSLSPADMDFIEAKNTAAREIALAFGVPPMLLGIPGDNTYANYREANLAFWKQTIVPLVKKAAAAMTAWLAPAYPKAAILCRVNDIEALSAERDALWTRVARADFLTDDEKRAALGFPSTDELDGEA